MCEYCSKDGYYNRNKSLISKTLKNNVDIDLSINVKDKKLVASIENLTMNLEDNNWILPTKKINFCPMCRKKVRRLKSMKDKELDIPIKNHFMQLELEICMECGKRKAKYLCDYITGKSFDLYGKGKIETLTCDKLLCEKCTNKLNSKDYCKEHIKQLREEINENLKR